jgi:pyruvate,water dikinase
MLRGRKTMPKLLESMERRILARSKEDLSPLSGIDLFNWLLSASSPEWRPPFMLANAIGSGWFGIARRIAGKHLGAPDFDALAGGLMVARGGIVSANHAYELQAIRHRFAPGSQDYEKALAEWIEKYGHRCFNELDIASPRWREVPDQVELMAQGLEAGPIDPSTAQATRDRAQATLRGLPLLVRPFLAYAIDKAAEGFRIREQAKSCWVATYGISRLVILEWGRRLASENRIAQRDDAFFLTFADFWAWAAGYWNGEGAQSLVAERKRQLAAWQSQPDPADVILEKAESLEVVRPTARPLQGNRLQGSGVSPGQAHGAASKLQSPSDAAHLKNGDILVARFTDPSWTPLFLRASGIVVEFGGYLSHGAIVAREFGLPAVVNIPGCFDAIPDQAQLFVDGSRGVVEIGSAQPSTDGT